MKDEKRGQGGGGVGVVFAVSLKPLRDLSLTVASRANYREEEDEVSSKKRRLAIKMLN